MSDVVRKVFTPDIYEIEFGGRTVELKPLPSGKARELLTKVRGLGSWFSEMGSEVGEMNTFEAIAFVIEKGFGEPYEILKFAIPDLTQEEVDSESIKKILWVLNLIVEQNGFDWALGLLKNWLGQLKDQIPRLVMTYAQVLESNLSMSSTPSSKESAESIDSPPATSLENLPSSKSSTSSTKRKSGKERPESGT